MCRATPFVTAFNNEAIKGLRRGDHVQLFISDIDECESKNAK